MSLSTVSAHNLGFPWPSNWGTSGVLKIFSTKTFVSGSLTYPAGRTSDPVNQNFCVQANITVVGSTATVASFQLPQTDASGVTIINGSGEPLYVGVIYSNVGRTKQRIYFENWHLSTSLTTSFSFEAWAVDNAASGIVNPPSVYLDSDEVQDAITARLNAPASTTALGILKVSTTPSDTANPTAVGTNDPRVPTQSENDALVGTNGSPSSSNPYVTNSDPRLGASASGYASLAAAVAAIGSTPTLLSVATAFPSGASCTVPVTLALEFEPGGSIVLGSGHTVIIRSDPSAWPVAQIFSGTGTLSVSGSNLISEMLPEWFGGKGDDATDSTVAVQTILNVFAAANKDTVVRFGAGKYVIAGALQDTLLSNAQIVLPKRTTLQSMLSVTFKGANAPSTPWNNDSGTILKSTLSSGNGVMIGVKNNQGSGVATASAYMSNASSNIYVALENITLQLPINPTNSALDLSKIRNGDLRNVRIVTGDFAQGGANPIVSAGTAIPDLAVTIPTTATSYALNLPTNLPNNVNIDGLFIAGFYTGIRTGELTKGRNIVMHACNVGFQVEGAIWPSTFENVVIAATARPIKVTGAKPDQTGFPDTVNTATIFFTNFFGVENDPANAVVYVVDDANGYLSGTLPVFYGAGAALPLNLATTSHLQITRVERPWNRRDPSTDATGAGIPLSANSNFAVDELKSGFAVSNDTGLPWFLLTTNQSGTANGIGVIAFINDAIANGQDKRVAQIFGLTDGAINSGKMIFGTMNAGTFGNVGSVDHLGKWIIGGGGTSILRIKHGTAVLVAGTVTVNDASITANSRIILTSQVDGGTPGWLRVSGRSAGVSFSITSSNGADTSTIGYLIVEP